jgi:hypothetical protein
MHSSYHAVPSAAAVVVGLCAVHATNAATRARSCTNMHQTLCMPLTLQHMLYICTYVHQTGSNGDEDDDDTTQSTQTGTAAATATGSGAAKTGAAGAAAGVCVILCVLHLLEHA